ncbi:ATP-binding protein [Streptomyces sp. NPDC002133]|uniref:ATP-binding protein n=1 Tax=Streptomyces sp. NPDC002133 TaxID=3154409 RepID=UPI0033331DC1
MTMTATRANAMGAPGYSETLQCEPEAARRARLLVTAALHTWRLGDLTDASRLIVSELVSNAIDHTRCRLVRITVGLVGEGRVRIAVADKSRAAPALRGPGVSSETGRGLLLVNALSHRWGYDRHRWGKVVWAELRLKAEEPKA